MKDIDWYGLWYEKGFVEVPDNLISHLETMLYDLQTNFLKVYLVPLFGDDNYKRKVNCKNVEWYRKLCQLNPKPEYKVRKNDGKKVKRRMRKNPQTNLKKSDIKRVLERMIRNQVSHSGHAPYLLGVAEDYYRVWQDNEEEARKLFGHMDDFKFKKWNDENPPF